MPGGRVPPLRTAETIVPPALLGVTVRGVVTVVVGAG